MMARDTAKEQEQHFASVHWREPKESGHKYCAVWYRETAQKICEEHDLDDIEGLVRLLRKLVLLTAYPSNHSIGPEEVNVPRDFPTWKQSKRKLRQLEGTLSKACAGLEAALRDHIQFAALQSAADEVDMAQLVDLEAYFEDAAYEPQLINVDYIRQLRDLVDQAASYKGEAKNSSNPDWHVGAANLCERFWLDCKGKVPKPYFPSITTSKTGGNATTEPSNEFSMWFCGVMKEVAGLTPSECQTALGKPPLGGRIMDLLAD